MEAQKIKRKFLFLVLQRKVVKIFIFIYYTIRNMKYFLLLLKYFLLLIVRKSISANFYWERIWGLPLSLS